MVEVTFHSTGRDFCPDDEYSFRRSLSPAVYIQLGGGGGLFSGHSAMTEAISQSVDNSFLLLICFHLCRETAERETFMECNSSCMLVYHGIKSANSHNTTACY